ncbi:MAG: hypothetical protein WC089_02950 [Candidatus Paceibacterota bacterium]
MNKENKKSYLPSHEFVARVIILVLLLGAAVGGNALYKYFKNKKDNKSTSIPTDTIRLESGLTVSDVMSKDSNKNGIADWEESLWGLDPKSDGFSNKTIIDNKKKALNTQNGTMDTNTEEKEDETKKLAIEFFSSFMSLKESGALNTNAVENLTSVIGQEVGNTETPDTYIGNSIKTTKSNKENLAKYQKDLENIITKHENRLPGTELEIMARAMENEDSALIGDLAQISNEYRSLAKDMTTITAPMNVAQNHLLLINAYDKIGISIIKMSDALTNPVAAATGTAMYTRYTNEINQIVEEMKTTFIDNGILEKDAN